MSTIAYVLFAHWQLSHIGKTFVIGRLLGGNRAAVFPNGRRGNSISDS